MCKTKTKTKTELLCSVNLFFDLVLGFDDAFFQPELGWSVKGGRWVRPRLLAGWTGGCRIVWAVDLRTLNVSLLCQNKEEGGSSRASPVAAPMPKSVSLLEKIDAAYKNHRCICVSE